MERLPGQPLTKASLFSIRRILLEMQLKLHALDADVLLQALAREDLASVAAGGPALGREAMTVDGYLASSSGGSGAAGFTDWLAPSRGSSSIARPSQSVVSSVTETFTRRTSWSPAVSRHGRHRLAERDDCRPCIRRGLDQDDPEHDARGSAGTSRDPSVDRGRDSPRHGQTLRERLSAAAALDPTALVLLRGVVLHALARPHDRESLAVAAEVRSTRSMPRRSENGWRRDSA